MILLLTSPLAPGPGRRALQQALGRVGAVRQPAWDLDPSAVDLLARPAGQVLDAFDSAAGPAVLCGVGGGALVALRVAAEAPSRVAGLVLATGRGPTGRVLVRSVHRAVADLAPLAVLQRLHADQRLLLQTLDAVRPQDFRPLALRVDRPALVGRGARDPLDRKSAEQLAAVLPYGRLVPVSDAGPGWVWTTPDRLAALAATLG